MDNDNMLEILLEKVCVNKSYINGFFNNLQSNIDVDLIKDAYVDYDFADKRPSECFAAIDGSFNKKKFMAAYVYALSSQTILFDPVTGMGKGSSAADLNFMSTVKTRKVEKILSQQMNILELKSMIDTLQRHPEISYFLMDGSVSGSLLYLSVNYGFPVEIKDIVKRMIYCFEEILRRGDFPIEVTAVKHEMRIIEYVKQNLKSRGRDVDIDSVKDEIIGYFTGLEQLACINYVLQNFSDKIVGISKTSSTQNLFKQQIPDSAALEYVCKNTGYTRPTSKDDVRPLRRVDRSESKVMKVDFPIHNSELTGVTFTTFFTRLEKAGNILKIELPYKLGQNDEKMILMLEDLKSICVEGYPYILKKAHDDVVIKSSDMQKIMRKLEIFEKTGRDMLEK